MPGKGLMVRVEFTPCWCNAGAAQGPRPADAKCEDHDGRIIVASQIRTSRIEFETEIVRLFREVLSLRGGGADSSRGTSEFEKFKELVWVCCI